MGASCEVVFSCRSCLTYSGLSFKGRTLPSHGGNRGSTPLGSIFVKILYKPPVRWYHVQKGYLVIRGSVMRKPKLNLDGVFEGISFENMGRRRRPYSPNETVTLRPAIAQEPTPEPPKAKKMKECPSCSVQVSSRKFICSCGYDFLTKTKRSEEPSTPKIGKKCPACIKVVACRQKVCVCGHDFTKSPIINNASLHITCTEPQPVTIPPQKPVSNAEHCRRGAEARRLSTKPKGVDPVTCDINYTDDQWEFMAAVQAYKERTRRMFPTLNEIYSIFISLGYSRSEEEAKAG